MMDSKPTSAMPAEFVQLIEAAKNYLMFRQDIFPQDLGLSENSLAILNSWKTMTKQTVVPLEKGFIPNLRGEGNHNAALFIVTEELQRGISPYGGDAGELFLKILGAIDLTRKEVYITAIRASGPISGAVKRIKRELNVVKPTVICTLGKRAAEAMLGQRTPLQQLRGRFHDFNGIPLMPTFHPSALIDDVSKKRPVWEDMKMIKSMIQSIIQTKLGI